MRDPFDVISNYQTKDLCLAYMGLKRIKASDDIDNELEMMLEANLDYQLQLTVDKMEAMILKEKKKGKNMLLHG